MERRIRMGWSPGGSLRQQLNVKISGWGGGARRGGHWGKVQQLFIYKQFYYWIYIVFLELPFAASLHVLS